VLKVLLVLLELRFNWCSRSYRSYRC